MTTLLAAAHLSAGATGQGGEADPSRGVVSSIEADSLRVAADSLKIEERGYRSGQSVGLVLSGGGAKGIAHIGVIKALEDHNIPIDYIAGTSMGAIVGGLYACGYTPEEMIDLILSKGFASWSTGQIDPNLTYYFLKEQQTPAFANININLSPKDSLGRVSSVIPSSLISPLPMNFAFMDLFAAYTAQCGGEFDRLFVPFRCVTSNVTAKHKVVCRSGMLSDAIRASMSFPAVFEPIKLNGVEMYDGGIYDNFPVDVMREDFAPSIMIGVDVHTINPPPSNSIVAQLENMIIQNNDYDLPADEGIYMHVDASRFSLLDFGKAKEIYQVGYDRAMEMMDSICRRVTSRVPPETRRLRRGVFKSQTPYLRFATDSVSASGGTPSQNEYIEHLFRNARTDTFGIDHARLAYYRALTPGKLRNLFPQAHYNDSTGLFSLDLEVDAKNNFAIGAGGFLTSSINSMIFVSANYSSMSFSTWNTSLMGWIGQSYMAGQFDGKLLMTRNTPSALDLKVVYSRQKYYETDRLFFEDNSPAFVSRHEAFARLSYGWAVGRRGKASIGVGAGMQRNNFYANDRGVFTDAGREQTKMRLLQAIFRLEYNTLDNTSYPAAGTHLNVNVLQTLGNYSHSFDSQAPADRSVSGKRQHFFQAEVKGERYLPLGSRFSLGGMVDILVSNRKLLNSYYASLVNAPAFTPTVALEDVFNKAFHANSFAAVGIAPIWRPFQRAQVRLSAHAFIPFRKILAGPEGEARYGSWFSDPEFIGELDLVYNLPFASITGYVNYLSSPARNWNAGISFGLYFTADTFLR